MSTDAYRPQSDNDKEGKGGAHESYREGLPRPQSVPNLCRIRKAGLAPFQVPSPVVACARDQGDYLLRRPDVLEALMKHESPRRNEPYAQRETPSSWKLMLTLYDQTPFLPARF